MTDRTSQYQADSLSLIGAIALGTGVMIGAGIFALTGQMAQMAGSWFPLAFLSAALIVSFSAYSYVKLSNAYPSAGGIAMYLEKSVWANPASRVLFFAHVFLDGHRTELSSTDFRLLYLATL
jgi:amino acid transporter